MHKIVFHPSEDANLLGIETFWQTSDTRSEKLLWLQIDCTLQTIVINLLFLYFA